MTLLNMQEDGTALADRAENQARTISINGLAKMVTYAFVKYSKMPCKGCKNIQIYTYRKIRKIKKYYRIS
jgi:hypothetical protein